MITTRRWVALYVTSGVIASAFCATPVVVASVGMFSWLESRHERSPATMLSIAQTFERQGRIAEAKNLYQQILARQPDSEVAKRRLAKIIAAEQRAKQKPAPAIVAQNNHIESSAERKPPTATPAKAPQVVARPVNRPSSNLDQRRAFVIPIADPDHTPSPKETTTIVTHSISPKSAVAVRDRSARTDDVPGHIRSIALRPYYGVSNQRMVEMLRERPANLEPHLAMIVNDESFHWEDRSVAAFLLGTLGTQAVAALPSLRVALRSSHDSFLKIDFAQAILLIQPEDLQAIDTLLDLLHASNANANVEGQSAFGPGTNVPARTMFEAAPPTETGNPDNRRLSQIVFLTLGAVGPAAIKAVPELKTALGSPDSKTRAAAQAALSRIVPARRSTQAIGSDSKFNSIAENE